MIATCRICEKSFKRYNRIQSLCPHCAIRRRDERRKIKEGGKVGQFKTETGVGLHKSTKVMSRTTQGKKTRGGAYLGKFRKPTGEAGIFRAIWDTRPHICTNCKAWLPEPPRTYYFAHKIRKGKDESQRLNPENIEIHCLICHQLKDQGTKKQYDARKKQS